jgi:CubicO group peptidase (beta-lactamase class C family)
LAGIAALVGVAGSRGTEAEALDGIVASFDAMRRDRGVPSIIVALVEGGHVTLAQRGVRSAASGEAVGPQTRYQAASMSKTIAALTALRLSQDGRVSLDQDVARLFGRRLPDRSGRAQRCDGAVLRRTGRRARAQAARRDSVRVLATADSVGRRHAGGRT